MPRASRRPSNAHGTGRVALILPNFDRPFVASSSLSKSCSGFRKLNRQCRALLTCMPLHVRYLYTPVAITFAQHVQPRILVQSMLGSTAHSTPPRHAMCA